MSLALLFPGQGVQHAAMLPWLEHEPAAAGALAAMAARIGPDWRTRLADPAWADSNHVAQCLLTGTGLGAWQVLRALGLPTPIAVAGYSVGELAACAAAEVFDGTTALALATSRAQLMDRSAADRPGAMLSVSGLGASAVEAVCRRWSVELAIRIGPDRCLLGGDVDAIEAATPDLAAQGAELARLRIRIASHTARMQPAADALAALVEPMSWKVPAPLVVSNFAGSATRRVNDLKRALSQQIAHTVQWQRCMETIAERRPRCVLEVGAGTSLSRMWLQAHPGIPVRSIDEFGTPVSAVAWVAACVAPGRERDSV